MWLLLLNSWLVGLRLTLIIGIDRIMGAITLLKGSLLLINSTSKCLSMTLLGKSLDE